MNYSSNATNICELSSAKNFYCIRRNSFRKFFLWGILTFKKSCSSPLICSLLNDLATNSKASLLRLLVCLNVTKFDRAAFDSFCSPDCEF